MPFLAARAPTERTGQPFAKMICNFVNHNLWHCDHYWDNSNVAEEYPSSGSGEPKILTQDTGVEDKEHVCTENSITFCLLTGCYANQIIKK